MGSRKKAERGIRTAVFFGTLIGSLLLLGGCAEEPEKTIDSVTISQGAEQYALPRNDYPELLRLTFHGPRHPGLLGGSGSRHPAVGVKVRIRPAPGSDLAVEPAETRTDAGGMIAVKVRAGRKTGDQFLIVTPENFPQFEQRIRFISGMQIDGDGAEMRTGGSGRRLAVQLVNANGNPATDVPVRFSLGSTVEGIDTGARLADREVKTDARGIAGTTVNIGEKTGLYHVNVEISSPESGFVVRSKPIRLLGFNLLSVILSVLGGLALFIYGMKLMSDGLLKVAGENMRKILQFFSSNRIVALLAGALVTAVIQSSTTTVMVIGFINAGLLNLTQALGIIFGANIGTTVTAQIISFNLTGMALPAITLGFVITFSQKRLVNGWGVTILGFGLLFFGMNIMSGEMRALGDLPTFVNFFKSFDCRPANQWMPLGAVLGAMGIGIAATMLLQSSAATLGIVLALAGGGLINFYTAVPLLLGTNIGTTITAMLAGLSANRVAKQAALAHTLFNVFGALLMLILFYVPYGPEKIPCFLYFINAITPGDVFAALPQNIERHIAMAHTFFNIGVALILLPVIPQFAKFCNWLLPLPENKPLKITVLEPGLLNTPSVALKQSLRAIRVMVQEAWVMTDRAVNGHFIAGKADKESAAALAEAEERIDQMQAEVTAYLVQLTRHTLTEPQSELVPLLMHCTNDAERIADHTEVILQLTDRLLETNKKLSDSAKKDMEKMWEVLDDQAQNVIAALKNSDSPETTRFALKDERKINKLADKFESAHIERLRKGNCTAANGIIFIEMLGELAKIGDHLSNIAERTPEVQKHCIKL